MKRYTEFVMKVNLIIDVKKMFKTSLFFFFRTYKMVPEKTSKTCINLGSYNYLGFAENCGPITEEVIETSRKYGLATCSSRQEVRLVSVLES